jgi:hypothetical protein
MRIADDELTSRPTPLVVVAASASQQDVSQGRGLSAEKEFHSFFHIFNGKESGFNPYTYTLTQGQGWPKWGPEAVFLVMCDPSMKEL